MSAPVGFEMKHDILQNLKKFVYSTAMFNRASIWASRRCNTDFRPVFVVNRQFLIKPNANLFRFWVETQYFSKPLKIVYITGMSNRVRIWDSRRWNTYFWSIFTVNRRLSIKMNVNPFGFWAETQYSSKTSKMCIEP
jgi:hypothetical protein